MTYLDLLKLADEHDTDEKKAAVAYLEEAHRKKDDFVRNLVTTMSDRITKDELRDRLMANCFQSYRLRMAVAGIAWLTDADLLKRQ